MKQKNHKKNSKHYKKPSKSLFLSTLFVTFSILLGGILFSAKTLPAQAQSINVYDLGITPQVSYWHVKPGETVTHTINLKNQGINTLEVSPTLVDFTSDGESGIPVLQDDNSFPYTSLINPDVSWDQPFILRPGQEKDIKLRIEPPLESDVKEHHLTILFKANQAIFEEAGQDQIYNAAEDSNSLVSGTVGSNLVVLVAESDQNNGTLTVKKLTIPKVIDSFKPITFSILSQNEGINATPIQGKASVFSLTKKRLIEYTLYPDMILANSARKVRGIDSTIIDEIKESGLEESEISQLTYDFTYKKPFLFGIYTVEIILGDTEYSTNVIALPLSPLAFFALITIGISAHKYLTKNTKK